MGSLADKLSPRRPESPFIVTKLKYGGYALALKRDRERGDRHICDFRSEDEANTWIYENAAKFSTSDAES